MRVDFFVPPLLSRTPTSSVEFYSSHKEVEIGESAGLDQSLNKRAIFSILRAAYHHRRRSVVRFPLV
ncbi:hypothetical protein SUGI_0080570 [Cryptomeria japonica]|nr:hypothetical protein SUGI_0080570 [Cryptomeria japonica]